MSRSVTSTNAASLAASSCVNAPERSLHDQLPAVSLGTLIRVGNDFLFSGEWWVTIFPGTALVLMVLSINLLGDWLRDALNPRLR